MRALILATLVLSLTIAGCSSSDNTMTTSSGAPTSSTTTTGMTMNTTAKTVTVTIQGNAFAPANVTINVGDTIHWVNMDQTTPHSVVADDSSFGSGACPGQGCLIAGTSAASTDHYDYKFAKAGTFPYPCGVHANMKATVTVVGMMM